MGASLPDHGLLNRKSAARAGAVGLLVDLKMVLKGAAAVDPVETGSVGFDPVPQGEADGCQKLLRFPQVKRLTGPQRVYAGGEQGFIRVDIPQPGDEVLVEQKGFDLPLFLLQHGVEGLGRQRRVVRFWSERGKQLFCVRHKPDSAEFAWVIETEAPPRAEIQRHPVVEVGERIAVQHAQVAAHTQVDDQRPL